MYTLRIIEETRENTTDQFQQVVENFYLGNSYSIIKNGASKEFDSIIESKYPDASFESNKEGIRALICAQNGVDFFVWVNDDLRRFDYFIMTENGKTFEKL